MFALLRIFKSDDTGRYDKHLILFFLNVFLVILGYSLRGSSFQVVKLLRLVLVIVSLGGLVLFKQDGKFFFSNHKSWVLWFLILLNLFLLVFSVDFMSSFSRIVAWLPFLVYINLFITYLFRVYHQTLVKIKLLQLINLVYLYPLLIFFLNNPFLSQNIYGMNIGGFKTNTFGWAGMVAFVTSIDILTNVNPGKFYKKILIFSSLLAVYLIFISGSRSSYLCLAISMLIIIINSNRVRFVYKILISLLIVSLSFYMIQDENSAINKRIKKTESQIEKGETRFTMAETALETMIEYPNLLITGFGFDNFREGIFQYKQIRFELPSHNSYLELFTTTGGISFIFFFVFFVLNAIIKYIKFDIRKFVFLPTLLIIPFFESNLNAGQYLFFPWMTFLFYYIHANSTQIPIEKISGNIASSQKEAEIDIEVKYFI